MSLNKFKSDMAILTEKLTLHITQKENNDSILKGFVDSNGNLYPITLDTKVLSKVVEFVFIPVIKEFCEEYNYKLEEPTHQNHYPDLTFIDLSTGFKYAVDIKTTYRITDKEFTFLGKKYLLKKNKHNIKVFNFNDEYQQYEEIHSGKIVPYPVSHEDPFKIKIQQVLDTLLEAKKVNGMTLGAYTGYFRDRESTKNILYPYSSYHGHYVIGMIYSREESDNIQIKHISDYQEIESPIYDIKMFFVEKYRIATTSAGSGNTKNIGSLKNEIDLILGNGPFKTIESFDKFWLTH